MKLKKNVKNTLYSIVMIIVIVFVIVVMSFVYEMINKNASLVTDASDVNVIEGFNNTIIQEFNKNSDNKNYMFSPYSLEVVLSMLRDGSSGDTYKELSNLVPERNIKHIFSKERINVANGLFIKEGIEVKDSYKDIIVNRYNSVMIYDKFKSPVVINNWVKNETFGMIPKALDEVSQDFVMAIGNAVAIDVEWSSPFICNNTKIDVFKTIDNKKINVAMMHNSYEKEVSYYEDEDATYVSIPYVTYDDNGKYLENGVSLEFIGILPNDNVNDYISSFNFNNINKILHKMNNANKNLRVNVDLPRFKFDNDFSNVSDMLKKMGLKDTFSSTPNFSRITDESIFISQFIHKTFIDLNEVGTKAAAVTLVTFDANSVETTKPKEVDIKFDKPFIYLIKDKDSKEILFFGVVYSPDEYTKTDVLCEEEA